MPPNTLESLTRRQFRNRKLGGISGECSLSRRIHGEKHAN
jgi:hypothetical protein